MFQANLVLLKGDVDLLADYVIQAGKRANYVHYQGELGVMITVYCEQDVVDLELQLGAKMLDLGKYVTVTGAATKTPFTLKFCLVANSLMDLPAKPTHTEFI